MIIAIFKIAFEIKYSQYMDSPPRSVLRTG